jgi:hypothetical protein
MGLEALVGRATTGDCRFLFSRPFFAVSDHLRSSAIISLPSGRRTASAAAFGAVAAAGTITR